MIDMRTRSRRAAGVLLTLVVGLGMTACVGGEPLPTLPPTPDSTPIFGSEEEALAAAEAAYAAYLEMSNLISSEGGVDPERIASVAIDELFESSLEGFATLRNNQWRTVGMSVLTQSQLQFADLNATMGEEAVAAYVCVDVSGVDVLGPDGTSVVAPDRPDLQGFEVFFTLSDNGGYLLPSSRAAWEASSICGES